MQWKAALKVHLLSIEEMEVGTRYDPGRQAGRTHAHHKCIPRNEARRGESRDNAAACGGLQNLEGCMTYIRD